MSKVLCKLRLYQQISKNVLEEEILDKYNEQYFQIAETFFMKTKGKYKSFENKYLEKLRGELKRGFERYKTSNNEKRLLKQATVFFYINKSECLCDRQF